MKRQAKSHRRIDTLTREEFEKAYLDANVVERFHNTVRNSANNHKREKEELIEFRAQSQRLKKEFESAFQAVQLQSEKLNAHGAKLDSEDSHKKPSERKKAIEKWSKKNSELMAEWDSLKRHFDEVSSDLKSHLDLQTAWLDQNEKIREHEDEVCKSMLLLMENMFVATRNPVCVWVAISLTKGLYRSPTLPLWCHNYIMEVSVGIHVLTTVMKNPSAGEVSRLLGLHASGKNAFQKYKTELEHFRIFSLAKAAFDLGARKNETIAKLSEEIGIEQRSLQRIIAKAKDFSIHGSDTSSAEVQT